jgi:hypothetical protein
MRSFIFTMDSDQVFTPVSTDAVTFLSNLMATQSHDHSVYYDINAGVVFEDYSSYPVSYT